MMEPILRTTLCFSFPNIQILLYFDEFMVFNPLRGNQAKHKLGAFYFTLGNIPI